MFGRPRRERGQALVEYALVLPLLLLIILGIIEFAIVIWSYDTIANAAREGVRSAIIYPYDMTVAEAVVRTSAGPRPTGPPGDEFIFRDLRHCPHYGHVQRRSDDGAHHPSCGWQRRPPAWPSR